MQERARITPTVPTAPNRVMIQYGYYKCDLQHVCDVTKEYIGCCDMQHGLFGIEIRRILYSGYLQEIPLTIMTEAQSTTHKVINH